MPNLRQWPVTMKSGCRRSMGFLVWRLVRWDKLQPTLNDSVSLDTIFQKWQYFMCQCIPSSLKCPQIECYVPPKSFLTISFFEYTTILSSLPFFLPPFLLPWQLYPPLLFRSSSLPFHCSPPVSISYLHTAKNTSFSANYDPCADTHN